MIERYDHRSYSIINLFTIPYSYAFPAEGNNQSVRKFATFLPLCNHLSPISSNRFIIYRIIILWVIFYLFLFTFSKQIDVRAL